MTDPKLSRIERLRVAGAIAPRIRDAAHKRRKRPVKVVDATGRVVREIDTLTLHEKLRERARLSFDVTEDAPVCLACGQHFWPLGFPERLLADAVIALRAKTDVTLSSLADAMSLAPSTCGRVVKELERRGVVHVLSDRAIRVKRRIVRGRRGGVRSPVCGMCRGQSKCAGWGGTCKSGWPPPPSYAFEAGRIRKRHGEPWRCKSCEVRRTSPASETLSELRRKDWTKKTQAQRDEIARKQRERWAKMTIAERRAIARKSLGSLTSEQLSEMRRADWSKRTPEQRREIGRKARDALTPDQRRERAIKREANMTPEQRSDRARRVHASMTPDQRRERARKISVTKKARQRTGEPHD